MIDGAHVILYSKDAAADRAFMRDVLKLHWVDANQGWLIFKLPPAEMAVHPADANDRHEFYLMSDDLEQDMKAMTAAGASFEAVTQQRWGRVTRIRLPGGGALGLYQPLHERP